jgi:hypothetical protein
MPTISSDTESIDWEVKKYSRLGALIVCILSLLVIVGWITNISLLKSILPGFQAMNPLAAISFILLSFSLVARTHYFFSENKKNFLAFILSLSVILIGIVTIVGYSFNLNLGWDQVFFANSLSGNRIAPNTALNFILLGMSLITLQSKSKNLFRISQFCVLLAGLVTILAMVGYLYNALSLYDFAQLFPMSLNSALAFSFLCASILLSTPSNSVVRIFIGNSKSNALARYLFGFVLFFPIFVGYFIILGKQAEIYSFETGIALTVVISMIILTTFVWWYTKLLRQDEEIKERNTQILSDRTIELEETQKILNRKVLELVSAKEEIRRLLNHENNLKEIVGNE